MLDASDVTGQLLDSLRQTYGSLTKDIKCCLMSCSNRILCQKEKFYHFKPTVFADTVLSNWSATMSYKNMIPITNVIILNHCTMALCTTDTTPLYMT